MKILRVFFAVISFMAVLVFGTFLVLSWHSRQQTYITQDNFHLFRANPDQDMKIDLDMKCANENHCNFRVSDMNDGKLCLSWFNRDAKVSGMVFVPSDAQIEAAQDGADKQVRFSNGHRLKIILKK